jgi:hypothetical protein
MNRVDYFDSSRLHSFNKIVDYGTYYFPAWRHYGNTPKNVICDKCLKSNLVSCIGYGQQDLCLQCADRITENLYNFHSECRCGKHHESRDRRDISLEDVCDEVRVVRKNNLD